MDSTKQINLNIKYINQKININLWSKLDNILKFN